MGSRDDIVATVNDQIGDQMYPPFGTFDFGNQATYNGYDTYGSDLNYTTQTGSVGTMGDGTTWYDDQMPGGREDFHAEFENAVESELAPNASPVIRDDIDWQVGGQAGVVNRFPYSTHGPVSSDGVENFSLTGEQIYLRRETEQRQLYGPVGTSDSSALLALAYAQMQNQYYPNESSQIDLVMSV
jgi:hypothetical protein